MIARCTRGRCLRLPLSLTTVLAASGGCASGLQTNWAPDDVLVAPSVEAYKGHAAVVLLDELTVSYVELPRDLYQRRAIHRAIAVLTEDGLDVGDVRIVYPKSGKIESFEARTIAADGTVTSVEPTKVFDEASKDKDGFSVRTASLPKVSVGSIVEYRAVIRYPNPYSSDWEVVSGDYPVKRYRVDFRGPNSFRWQAQAYNFPADSEGWHVESQGKNWRLWIELEDVPAQEDEGYVPARWETEPRWAFIVRQYLDGTKVYNWSYDWKYAIDHRAEELYWDNKAWYAGFDYELDVSACKDVPCKVAAGLEWLNQHVALLGFGSWPGRPAEEVLNAETGYGLERNRMLWKMLDDLGIQAHFAFGRTRHAGTLDRNLPLYAALNHGLLVLPEQPGLSSPLFVDATCEWCAPGRIPAWFIDQEVVVMIPKKEALANTGDIEIEWVEVRGEPAPPEKSEYRVEAQLNDEGTLEGFVQLRGLNRAAHAIREDTYDWDEDDWKLASRRLVKRRAPTIEVANYTKYERTPIDEAARRVEFSAPSYAVQDGERWLIPLTGLDLHWDRTFKYAPSKRDLDVRFLYAYHTVEVFDLTLPEGYVVRDLPEDVSAGTAPLEVEARFERTSGGIRVTRSVRATPGVWSKDEHYARLRATLDALREVRTRTLVAVPEGAVGEPVAASP